MRIRASVLTPVLAILTVAAIISTGIVLGQERHGQADATLLGPTPAFAASASEAITVVAESQPAGDGTDRTKQPAARTTPTMEPLSDDPGVGTEDQVTLRPPATTTRPTVGAAHDPTQSGVGSDESDADVSRGQTTTSVQPATVQPTDDDVESPDVGSTEVETEHDGSDSHERGDD